jgi:hypothetical protein
MLLLLPENHTAMECGCREVRTIFCANRSTVNWFKNLNGVGDSRGPDSSVGIATGYGLDGPEIESRWGRDFPHCPDRPWGPPSLLYNGYQVFPGGRKRPGRDADPLCLLVPRYKNRGDLYRYSS